MTITNKQITLRSRPEFDVDPNLETGTFQRNQTEINDQDLQPGHALIKIEYVSIDPAMRGWLRDARSYLPPVQINEVMRAGGVGSVIKSNSKHLKVGDRVSATVGWQQYVILKDGTYTKLSEKGESLDYLGVFGSSGQTAYWGLFDVAKAKEGDVIVVTGAAGSVGSIVVQLAKSIPNTKVVAVAGGAEKCKWVKEVLGADYSLDYKADGFAKIFRSTLKDLGYANCVFENVGGEILDLSLNSLKIGARIALCGAVSDYNTNKPAGLRNYTTLIAMRATLEGFIVFDYQKRYGEAVEKMTQLMKEGKLTQQFTVEKGGLEACPGSLVGLFNGKNKGKQVVKID